ncbi:autotransporter outer membrane beta-barrel domain-containing protein [Fusobacterium perfoetens]|uniref:autotransporter outer membrane beta-barrel domain-containing protein n=1 Tax=Fusobacterium perfoetens TaxID=852 RepID=UPI001F2E61A2|nr:autotransporter outer membrane beta-barrel domain-containing protein [Fusobacterium perfoetens]MCF2612149.1 autotransporter domain-containing protein [Fusobacterium perfoetens]
MNKIIKIIIPALIFSLTGCGGGGGGGGGSNVTIRPNIPNPPSIAIPNINDGSYDNENVINTDKPISWSVSKKGEKVIGVSGKNIDISGEIKITDIGAKNIEINSLNNYSFGIFSENGNVNNKAEVILSGDKTNGIFGKDSDITNNLEIKSEKIEVTKMEKIDPNEVIGIFSTGSSGIVRNNGSINLSSNNKSIGMYLDSSLGVNNKTINVTSNNLAIGMFVVGKNGSAINNNKINVDSKKNGYGMVAGYGATAKNNGTINIKNKGYGMYAFSGGYALNGEGAVINLSSVADGAMLADGNGSIVENRGTINIDKDNTIIKKGEELKAINGGRIINKGVINKNGDLFLSMDRGFYQIGTSENGSYGKIKSKNLSIDGNLEIDSTITKGSYKEEYLLEDVFEAEKLTLDKNTNVLSNSILYDALLEKNSFGNIDGKLVKNGKELKDFVKDDLDPTANIFNKYYNEEDYLALDEASKNILDRIDLSNDKGLEKSLEELTPRIYGNIQKEILDINSLFEENRINSLENIGNKENNFVLLENYQKVEPDRNILGYKNLTSGFLGTKSLRKDNYLSVGYGYSNIDYDNDDDSKIHSINVGIDKIIEENDTIFKVGFGGLYNYHKNTRKYGSQEIKSKFDSYGINSYFEVSKIFKNKNIDFVPFVGASLGYYSSESFDENINNFILDIEKQDFISCEPRLGVEIRKSIKDLEIFSKLSYSYELGNMDKNLDYTYRNLNERNKIENLEEKDSLDFKIGSKYSNENIWVSTNLGKDFGENDNRYVEFNFGYRF